MSKAIVSIAKNVGQVESIVDRLQTQAAIPVSDISVLVPDTSEARDIGHVKATKAPEGATTGVVAGGITGGVLGLLAGIGTLAIPGLGALIAAGPIMGALGGAAAGGATGGIVGALIGMGIPEFEAKAYEDKLRDGNYLIAVHNVDGKHAGNVRDILKHEGAEHISSVGENEAR